MNKDDILLDLYEAYRDKKHVLVGMINFKELQKEEPDVQIYDCVRGLHYNPASKIIESKSIKFNGQPKDEEPLYCTILDFAKRMNYKVDHAWSFELLDGMIEFAVLCDGKKN